MKAAAASPIAPVRLVLVFWGALFFVLTPLRPLNDDLYWQRWLGDFILRTQSLPHSLGAETFAAPGAPWVPQEWLFSVVVAFAMDRGLYVALSLIAATVPIAILLWIYFRARDRASPTSIACALIFCGIALSASFGVRAQVLGWACFAAFVFFLDRKDRWHYACIPAVIVWANLHASVALAPVFLVGRIAGELLDGGLHSRKAMKDLQMLPVVLLALLCTPLGWHLPAYSLTLATSPIRHFIQEWQPVGLSDVEFMAGALPMALCIVAGVRRKAANFGELVPLVLLFAAALSARRDVALFAIAAAPLAAVSLDRLVPAIGNVAKRVAEMERAALATVIVAAAVMGAAYSRQMRQMDAQPLSAMFSQLADGGASRRIFCENFSTCSAALQYPNLRVFMDGRCDPYPLPLWQAYMSTIELHGAWKQPFLQYGVDTIVAARTGRFAAALSQDATWHKAFDYGDFTVFRKG